MQQFNMTVYIYCSSIKRITQESDCGYSHEWFGGTLGIDIYNLSQNVSDFLF